MQKTRRLDGLVGVSSKPHAKYPFTPVADNVLSKYDIRYVFSAFSFQFHTGTDRNFRKYPKISLTRERCPVRSWVETSGQPAFFFFFCSSRGRDHRHRHHHHRGHHRDPAVDAQAPHAASTAIIRRRRCVRRRLRSSADDPGPTTFGAKAPPPTPRPPWRAPPRGLRDVATTTTTATTFFLCGGGVREAQEVRPHHHAHPTRQKAPAHRQPVP